MADARHTLAQAINAARRSGQIDPGRQLDVATYFELLRETDVELLVRNATPEEYASALALLDEAREAQRAHSRRKLPKQGEKFHP